MDRSCFRLIRAQGTAKPKAFWQAGGSSTVLTSGTYLYWVTGTSTSTGAGAATAGAASAASSSADLFLRASPSWKQGTAWPKEFLQPVSMAAYCTTGTGTSTSFTTGLATA